MFERFAADGRAAFELAQEIARRQGAAQVEPEHLLLALAGGRDDPAARAIVEAGLDSHAIEQAIEQDLVAALEVVGVAASVVASVAVHPRADRPRLGPQIKQAIAQAVHEAARRGEGRLRAEHLLLGLLEPPAIGVGRVLARLGLEPQRLVALTRVEMAAGRW